MVRLKIKQLVEDKFGKEINYPKDCTVLADVMREEHNLAISASTLKRLFGFYKEIQKPRLYTLDMIAKYLGYKNWSELDNQIMDDNTDHKVVDIIEPEKLSFNSRLVVVYSSVRKILLKFLGDCKFLILESTCTFLQKNDVVLIDNLVRGYPLVCHNVIRENNELGKHIIGKYSGITSLYVIPVESV